MVRSIIKKKNVIYESRSKMIYLFIYQIIFKTKVLFVVVVLSNNELTPIFWEHNIKLLISLNVLVVKNW